jgi:hypothetical protein
VASHRPHGAALSAWRGAGLRVSEPTPFAERQKDNYFYFADLPEVTFVPFVLKRPAGLLHGLMLLGALSPTPATALPPDGRTITARGVIVE